MPKEYRINRTIRAREVFLITESGERPGVVPLAQALARAEETGLDLVEVAPNAAPPVCRIMDYGKFQYEQSKKEKEARRSHKTSGLGEIRLRPKIGQHDVDFKVRTIRKLLEEGDKVKVMVLFRGREQSYPDLAIALLGRVVEPVNDISIVESPPKMEGRAMNIVLIPRKGKSTKGRGEDHSTPQVEEGTNGQVQTQDA
ncbi:MAG: translation initiation factor IF-3 [Chloroflexi bacterium]|nr:translation initiation factor IF-3 [Chloroflexota bacterium]